MLELAFETKSLRRLCESEARAKRDLGSNVADKLKNRLADMRAIACAKDLVVGHPRELDGPRVGQMAVDLSQGYRITFCANHPTVPRLGTGDVDWSRVRRIKVLAIEKNHE